MVSYDWLDEASGGVLQVTRHLANAMGCAILDSIKYID